MDNKSARQIRVASRREFNKIVSGTMTPTEFRKGAGDMLKAGGFPLADYQRLEELAALIHENRRVR